MSSERAELAVAVAVSPRPGVAVETALRVPAGSSALDAIRASGVLERFGAEIDLSTQSIGLWGCPIALDAPLRDGDRVEIYRALDTDPMTARRRRAAAQRASQEKRKRQ